MPRRVVSLIALAVAAIAIPAKPIVVRNLPVSFPLARRFNITGVPNILAADQARAKMLKTRSQAEGKEKANDARLGRHYTDSNSAA